MAEEADVVSNGDGIALLVFADRCARLRRVFARLQLLNLCPIRRPLHVLSGS
jgi:hypothetical protein